VVAIPAGHSTCHPPAHQTLDIMWTDDKVTFTLPVYYADYLINGDAEGLTDREKADIDFFLQEIAQEQQVRIVSMEDDVHFRSSNDLNMFGGDCATFVAIPL